MFLGCHAKSIEIHHRITIVQVTHSEIGCSNSGFYFHVRSIPETFPFRWGEQYLCYAMKGELPWKDRQMHIIFLNPSQPGRSYLSDTLKGRRGIHSHHHFFCCHTRSEGLAALCINWKQPPFHAGHNRTNDEQKSITKNVWRKDSFYNYTLCRYSIQQHLHKRKFVLHIT